MAAGLAAAGLAAAGAAEAALAAGAAGAALAAAGEAADFSSSLSARVTFTDAIGIAPSETLTIPLGRLMSRILSVPPVSYTHLDVYKRQASDSGGIR